MFPTLSGVPPISGSSARYFLEVITIVRSGGEEAQSREEIVL